AGLADISPYGKVVAFSNLWMELAGIWRGEAHGSKIYLPIAIAATWGWLASTNSQTRRLLVFVLVAILLILVAHLGGGIPLFRFLQPNRFAPVAYLFACVPAAIGVFAMVRAAQSQGVGWIRWAARTGLAVVGLIAAYSVNEVRQEISWIHAGHYG